MDEAEVSSTTDGKGHSPLEFESVKRSLQELEKEHAALEKELQELVEIRKSAEDMLEKARAKYNDEKSRYNKAQETMTVARRRDDQSNNQVKSLEDENNEKRKKIKELQEEVMKYKKKHLCNVEDFEENLKQMCDLFQHAVAFYTDEGLTEDIKKTGQETQDMQKMLEQTVKEIGKMNSELQDLSHQLDPWALDIALEQRKLVVQYFQAEHATAVEVLEAVRKEKQELEDEMCASSKSA